MSKTSIRLGVLGKSGNGKSYYTKNTLIPELVRFKPVIIFDRKGEYAGSRAKDIPAGLKWNAYESIFDFLAKNSSEIKKEVHVIKCRRNSDYYYGLKFFFTLSDAQLKGGLPVSIILEEAHTLLKAPDFKEQKRWLIELARHGRHEYLDLILISQRTLDIPTDVRSQISAWISFHQALENDIQALVSLGHPEAEKILDLEARKHISFGEIPNNLKKIK